MTKAEETALAGQTGWLQEYVYDRYGNRAVFSAQGRYIPDGAGTPQVTAKTEAAVEVIFGNNQWNGAAYDGGTASAGNVTAISGFTFTYDAENRLKTVVHGTQTTEYRYDGDGRRVEKVQGTAKTLYVYDAAGNLAAEYATTPGTAPCTTCYLTTDHLGSTRVMTDQSGAPVALHDYLPFGEEIEVGVNGRGAMYGAELPKQKFTGKERDTETGLDYFGARYLSAAQGRFTSPDEWAGGIVDPFTGQQIGQPGPLPYADIIDPQTLNKYAYVRNNPLRYIDPDGHCPWCIGALIGTGVGAVAQITADLISGEEITARKTFAAAVNGAIVGGTGGAATELGIAVQVAIVGSAGVVGGVTERAIVTGSMDQATKDPAQIVRDFGTNAGGHGINKAAEAAVTKVSGGAVASLTGQLEMARTPNRQGKIETRLGAAVKQLDQKKAAASTATDTAREAAIRAQEQSQGCQPGQTGCSR